MKKDFAKIEEIYHAALNVAPTERAAFLKQVCGKDLGLRGEVESLLSFDEKAGDFIESPPDDLAAEVLERRKNENLIGREFGHYRILSFLGAGGMGEVYLAEDVKLGRRAALKMLSPQFAADTERKRRFEREARAVSALNHPNIITIYGIEETPEFTFIATEFIEGQTLREKIALSPLEWRDAVEIAGQVARALQSAHSVGIIHRDIKPANIMVRNDGIVKVLDFGLAKLSHKTAVSGDAATLDQTGESRVMGTINYMSPEQALGLRLDARTDIFSLGVGLYEMLSGVQPFKGASDGYVYNATINKTPPPLREINPKVPTELETIVRRMLEKDRSDRYQTAEELRSDLQSLLGSEQRVSSGFSALKRKKRIPALAFPIAVVAFLLAIAGIYFAFFANFETAKSADAAKSLNFTKFTGNSDSFFPSVAPDGKTVLFSSRESGNWDVYFQRVGGANAINLTKDSPASDYQAVYSPDGEQIAFRSERDGGGIFLMGATGENVRRVSDSGFYPAWSPDGTQIVFSTANFNEPSVRYDYPGTLWAVNIKTGEKREIYKGDAVQPSWSPGGKRIAFWGIDGGGIRDIKTVSADGGEAVAVTEDAAIDWNPVWSPDGKFLYFASNRGGSMNFWRVAVDEETGEKLGEPEPFTVPSVFSQHLAFSADGKVMAYAEAANWSDIVKADFDAKTETVGEKTVITQRSRFNRNPAASPDGEWIAFDAIKDKQEDLFLMKKDGGNVIQLTNDIHKDRAASWSPDGKKIIFYSNRSGSYESWTINPDGTGLEQYTFNTESLGQFAFWSPDGTKILQNVGSNYPRIFDARKKTTEQTPFQLPTRQGLDRELMAFSWSPDGKRIAAMRYAAESEDLGILVYNLESQNYEVFTDYGETPVWLADSRRLIFIDNNKLNLLDTETGKIKEILAVPVKEYIPMLSVSPDNQFIYYSVQKTDSDIWLATTE